MIYRKKPVEIEAWNLTYDNKRDIFKKLKEIQPKIKKVYDDDEKPAILIPTLEGNMMARLGDYIIKGVNGELYPCKPNIFIKTYEKVE